MINEEEVEVTKTIDHCNCNNSKFNTQNWRLVKSSYAGNNPLVNN